MSQNGDTVFDSSFLLFCVFSLSVAPARQPLATRPGAHGAVAMRAAVAPAPTRPGMQHRLPAPPPAARGGAPVPLRGVPRSMSALF